MDKEQRYTYYIDEYDEFDWCVIDNTTDEKYEYLEEITKVLNKQADKIADLEAKLAVADDCADRYWKQLGVLENEETKRMEDFEKRCQEYYSTDEYKIDFAIAELEKVKAYIIKNNEPTRKMTEITRFINQQIKSLKGEK